MRARAYYNEIEPAAAHLLRALIDRNIIAPGEVDTRSIKDVQPDDLMGFTQCHFFAGGGIWSVAARLAGWPDERPLWTASCPCQGESVAGKKLGADDPRHLWPDCFRIIRARRPAVVVGEQVARAAGTHWLDGVWSDLEGEAYAFRAVDFPACAVDAPHIRQRLYWVAATEGVAEPDSGMGGRRADQQERGSQGRNADWRLGEAASLCVALSDADRAGRGELRRPEPISPELCGAECASGDARSRGVDQADTASVGWGEGRAEPSVRGWRDAAVGAGGRLEHWPKGSYWSDHEWRIGADGKARRVEPGLRLLVDGLPGRVPLLRIGGNAIVAQQAAEVIAALMDVLPFPTPTRTRNAHEPA